MKFSDQVKKKLYELLEQMETNQDPFVQTPGKDFSRNRKIGFKKTMQLILSMEAGSLKREILDFFQYRTDTVTVSAFIQQRKKLRLEAFYHLLNQFNSSFSGKKYRGYSLIACDGSVLSVPLEASDTEYSYFNVEGQRVYHQMELNALYDLCSRRYVDILMEPRKGHNERLAMHEMLERGNFHKKTIFVADRGYEGYKLFAHIISKGMYFVIRAKDGNTGGIVKGISLPKDKEYDEMFTRIYTSRKNQTVRENPNIYKRIHHSNSSYFIGLDNPYCEMTFRIVRIKLAPGKYECIITNLPQEEFSAEELKKIYGMRWGIETSFRELKYAIGLMNLHSKKVEFIEQEIVARLILYNFCEIITTHVIITQRDTTYEYQINYTLAIHICRYFLKYTVQKSPPDVEALIAKELLPVRPGRHSPRNMRSHSAVSFSYRVI